jgi:hypothetical protein
MALTWAQKKAGIMEIIETYYANALRDAGFVSYKSEGFHWYKVKDELLFKVHLPLFSPSGALCIVPLFGVIPLYSWELIAQNRPFRDWPGEMITGCEHVFNLQYMIFHQAAERRIGKLPRHSYGWPKLAHWLPNDLFVEHLNTERWGAEILDEAIFPLMESIHSPADLYSWHKETDMFLEECATEEEFVEKLLTRSDSGGGFMISQVLADECLRFRDEKLYPLVRRSMEEFRGSMFPKQSKEEKNDNQRLREHAQLLVKVVDSGDFSLFDAETKKIKKDMLDQIRKKLPDLMVE